MLTILDWSDWLLGTFYHRGVLPVDASYTTKRAVTLPHAIFGNFSILVITDVYNYVYEHNDEDDNLKSRVQTFSLNLLWLYWQRHFASKAYITYLYTPTKMSKSLLFTHRALSPLTFAPYPPSVQVLLLRCVTSCMTCCLVTNTPPRNKRIFQLESVPFSQGGSQGI